MALFNFIDRSAARKRLESKQGLLGNLIELAGVTNQPQPGGPTNTNLNVDLPKAQPMSRTGLLAELARTGAAPGVVNQTLAGMLAPPKPLDPTSTMINLLSTGVQPGTQEWNEKMNAYLTKPQVSINQGPKLPGGYMWTDPNDPTKGVKAIPGGPAGKETNTNASAISNAASAIADLKSAKEMFFPSGQFDRTLAASATVGLPNTKGREARQKMRRALEILLRARTGAQAKTEEVELYLDLYMPSALDSDKGALDKMMAAENFFSDQLNLMQTPGFKPGPINPGKTKKRYNPNTGKIE